MSHNHTITINACNGAIIKINLTGVTALQGTVIYRQTHHNGIEIPMRIAIADCYSTKRRNKRYPVANVPDWLLNGWLEIPPNVRYDALIEHCYETFPNWLKQKIENARIVS